MSIKFPHRGALIAVLTATVATSSCGGGGGGGGSSTSTGAPSAPIVAARAVDQTDLEIAAALYDGTTRTPDDFYADPAPSGHDFVSTEHLKNTDIAADDSTSQPTYELCSDDWNEALEWSELNAQKSDGYADLVATNDAEHYFEFGRVRNADPDFYLRERVFKCTYVDRTNADLRMSEGAAGSLNRRPITNAAVRDLSEYLWWFTPYNNFGHAVLKSSSTSTATDLRHTLHIASLERGGMTSGCDRIDVIEWRHTVDAATGELTLNVDLAFSFGARDTNGIAQLCSE